MTAPNETQLNFTALVYRTSGKVFCT